MILRVLIKSVITALDELDDVGNIIKSALLSIKLKHYTNAKTIKSQTSVIKNGIFDFYGNELDYFISLLYPFLAITITSSYNLSTVND